MKVNGVFHVTWARATAYLTKLGHFT